MPCGEGSPARAPHFIEIALKSAMDSPSMEPSGLELVVRDDYRVRIPVGFDANTLKRVLAVLEEAV